MTRALRLLLAAGTVAACAAPDAGGTESHRLVTPGQDYFIPPWHDPDRPARRHGREEEPRVVFINMDGVVLTCGPDDARSDISAMVCGGLGCDRLQPCDWPAFDPDCERCAYECETLEECKALVIRELEARWVWDPVADEALYNIEFTSERPERGDYEMVVVGGGGRQFGGVLGIAPLDCGDFNPNSVSFAFSNSTGFAGCIGVLVTTISQELAHALGLCHNDNQASMMFPAALGCDADWSCGNRAPREGECPCGAEGYCPSDYLLDLLGPAERDEKPPAVEILSPQECAAIGRDFHLRVAAEDDRAVAEVRLLVREPGAPPEDAELAESYDQAEPDGTFLIEADDYPAGGHVFCVVALDGAGNESEQACVHVQIDRATDCTPGVCCAGDHCCEQDADCLDRAPPGRPCSDDEDCRSLRCREDGHPGEARSECAPPARQTGCEPVRERGEILFPCERDDDCGDGQSCARRGDERFCTERCDPDDPDLLDQAPRGAACVRDRNGDRYYWAPATPGVVGGCDCAAGAAPAPAGLPALALAAAIALGRRRKRA